MVKKAIITFRDIPPRSKFLKIEAQHIKYFENIDPDIMVTHNCGATVGKRASLEVISDIPLEASVADKICRHFPTYNPSFTLVQEGVKLVV